MLRPEQSERLIALFALGALLLGWPLMVVFNRPLFVWGVPLLYLYLFAAWAVLVVLMALAATRHTARDDGGDPGRGG